MENWGKVVHLVGVLLVGGGVMISALLLKGNQQDRSLLLRYSFLPADFTKTSTRVFWVAFGVVSIIIDLYVQFVR